LIRTGLTGGKNTASLETRKYFSFRGGDKVRSPIEDADRREPSKRRSSQAKPSCKNISENGDRFDMNRRLNGKKKKKKGK